MTHGFEPANPDLSRSRRGFNIRFREKKEANEFRDQLASQDAKTTYVVRKGSDPDYPYEIYYQKGEMAQSSKAPRRRSHEFRAILSRLNR